MSFKEFAELTAYYFSQFEEAAGHAAFMRRGFKRRLQRVIERRFFAGLARLGDYEREERKNPLRALKSAPKSKPAPKPEPAPKPAEKPQPDAVPMSESVQKPALAPTSDTDDKAREAAPMPRPAPKP